MNWDGDVKRGPLEGKGIWNQVGARYSMDWGSKWYGQPGACTVCPLARIDMRLPPLLVRGQQPAHSPWCTVNTQSETNWTRLGWRLFFPQPEKQCQVQSCPEAAYYSEHCLVPCRSLQRDLICQGVREEWRAVAESGSMLSLGRVRELALVFFK